MAFKLPAIQQNVPVTDPESGMMTAYFSDWLARTLQQLVDQTNQMAGVIANLQAQQAQVVAALATLQATQVATAKAQQTADTAGGTSGRSGFATATLNVGLGWSPGPQINLSGVSAGNLAIHGSGPSQGSTTYADAGGWTGQWRIQEIIGAVETTVFSGTFTSVYIADPFGNVTYYLWNDTDTTNVSIPATSTGSVSYRLDLEFTDPVSAYNVVANLYVYRS